MSSSRPSEEEEQGFRVQSSVTTMELSRHKIEELLERALPFLVALLSVFVAILLPIAISTYVTINTKGTWGCNADKKFFDIILLLYI
jgi:hypothetical protein